MPTLSIRDFPEPVVHWLKVEALKKRIPMKKLIIRILCEYLDKHADEGWMDEGYHVE